MSMLVKPLTVLLSVALVLLGISGFFVDGYLFGLEVDAVHNIVHLLSGIIGLIASRNLSYARMFLIVFGFVYGAVAIVGFLTGEILGLFTVNDADNYLHTGIAVVCLVVGLFWHRRSAM